MIYYKRTVLASCFALASSISAKEVIPSLNEIIREIPKDNVRGRVEAAYMDGNFDEVEKGLFSYLDEYNFDNIASESVQEVKEKAWSMISERVEEMKTAAYVDEPSSPKGVGSGGPSPSEDEGVDNIDIDKSVKQLEDMTLDQIVRALSDGYGKTMIQSNGVKSDVALLTEADIDALVEKTRFSNISPEAVSHIKEIIYEKVEEKFGHDEVVSGANVGEKFGHGEAVPGANVGVSVSVSVSAPQLMEDAEPSSPEGVGSGGPSPFEDEGVDNIDIDVFVQQLEDMPLDEIVDELPDGELKMKIQGDVKNENVALTEADIDALVEKNRPSNVSRESVSRIEDVIHKKVEEKLGHGEVVPGAGVAAGDGVPQLMEGKSDIVDALHGIAVTQQKITDLIFKLEGGL